MRSGIYRPHRIVIKFIGKALKPGAFQKMLDEKERARTQLPIEADKTVWWLQDRNAWIQSEHVGRARITSDKDGSPKDIAVFPIYDNPKFHDGSSGASFFLGFDSNIYYILDRFTLFDATDPRAHWDTVDIIKRLRGIRGE